jgi:hypothetical protein
MALRMKNSRSSSLAAHASNSSPSSVDPLWPTWQMIAVRRSHRSRSSIQARTFGVAASRWSRRTLPTR